MKPNLIINGSAGRMGIRILTLALEEGYFEISACVDRPDHPDLGKDVGALAGKDHVGVMLTSTYPVAGDVMIDFSLPESTENAIEFCAENKVALVTGTTGLSETHLETLKKLSKQVAVVQATNMSVGMNVLFNIAPKLAEMLGKEYDIEIVEAHHRFKKDSPSGSALTLAKNIADKTKRPYPDSLVHGREGKDCQRIKGTIGMHAIRAGDITGEHSVIFSTLGETVTISHSAHDRDNFARGAIRAAKWIIDQKPGLYSMADVLGIE